MKYFKRIKSTIFPLLFLGFSFIATAQTFVSGGIYSNTTWTLVNSPYIVTDTVVVFPGVTLTIQAGVRVKFANNKRLEIRQAKIIALGTEVDSITFTSNSVNPSPGIWSSIFLNQSFPSKFNYCNFFYSNEAISGLAGIGADTIFLKNSSFVSNINGLTGYKGIIDSCKFKSNTNGIDHLAGGKLYNSIFSNNQIGMNVGGVGLEIVNCTIKLNQTGIYGNNGLYVKNCIVDSNNIVGIHLFQNLDSIINCKIRYNGIGYFNSDLVSYIYDRNIITKNIIEDNNIGIKTYDWSDSIFCNRICNNTSYGFSFYVPFNNNMNVKNNYWCTPDSASTEVLIYDGYDNINYGLVRIMPLDTLQCYLSVGLPIDMAQQSSFDIFPNPTASNLMLKLDKLNSNGEVHIYNIIGSLQSTFFIEKQEMEIDVSSLSNGIYIIEVSTGNKISRQKFIKQSER